MDRGLQVSKGTVVVSKRLVNAVTAEVGPGTQVSDLPTNQELMPTRDKFGSVLLFGVSPMDIKPRLKISILSGVFCAAAGSILGGIAAVVLKVVLSGPGDSAESFASFIPVAVLFAAMQAVPFGLIIGAIGGWWLAPRLAGDTQSHHIFLQSALMGAMLGSTFPILAIALGWGPLQNLVSVLPISIGIGIVCGLSLTALMRKFLPLTS